MAKQNSGGKCGDRLAINWQGMPWTITSKARGSQGDQKVAGEGPAGLADQDRDLLKVKSIAQKRLNWRSLVEALCSQGGKGD